MHKRQTIQHRFPEKEIVHPLDEIDEKKELEPISPPVSPSKSVEEKDDRDEVDAYLDGQKLSKADYEYFRKGDNAIVKPPEFEAWKQEKDQSLKELSVNALQIDEDDELEPEWRLTDDDLPAVSDKDLKVIEEHIFFRQWAVGPRLTDKWKHKTKTEIDKRKLWSVFSKEKYDMPTF